MYNLGKSQDDVRQMLIEQEVDETIAISLTEKFWHDHEFLIKETRKQKCSNAERDILIGSVFLACGLVITLLTYSASDEGGYYLFYYGAILGGLFLLVKGLIEKVKYQKR